MNCVTYSILVLALVLGASGAHSQELGGRPPILVDQLLNYGKKRDGRELFGKRSDPNAWFGRESRRGRELFGKRSAGGAFPASFANYGDSTSNSRTAYEPSTEYIVYPDYDYSTAKSINMRQRRSRELLGKRSAPQTFELSNDQIESLLSAVRRDRRGRGHELLG